MGNLEGLNRGEQQKRNRELFAYPNTFTRDKAIYEVLMAKGEPIEIEHKAAELFIYCPKEKSAELGSIIELLKLSPQYQLLESAKSVGLEFSRERVKMLKDVINADKRTLTDNEKMLFDPSYPASSSRRPLLYTPFAVSKEVRSNIIKIARQSQRGRKVDIRGALSRSVKFSERPQGPKDREVKSQNTKMGVFLDRFLKRVPPIIFEKQLMEQAYDDLTSRVGGRDFLSTYQLYSPRREEMIRNDFMDPTLILLEDLENRGYDIHLFRSAAPSGAYIETVDGIDDCIVALVEQKGRAALDELREPMSLLNELYRGRGVLYGSYIEHVDPWVRSGFSEEERNRLIAFARLKEVGDEESNFRLSRKAPDSQKQQYWQEVRREVRDLGVEPTDQIFLRGVIDRLVNRTTSK